jgi:hypothetical protein
MDSPTHGDGEHRTQIKVFRSIERGLAQLVGPTSFPRMQGCGNKGKEDESGPRDGGPRRGGSRRRREPNWGKKGIGALRWLIGGEGWCTKRITT